MRHGSLSAARLIAMLALCLPVACGKDTTHPADGDDPPDPPTRTIWVFDAPQPIYYGSPALSPDEQTVYFGTSLWLLAPPAQNHCFVALNAADGTVRWRLPLGAGQVRSSPVVAADGSIYFMIQGRNTTPDSLAAEVLCRLSPEGQIVWSYDINPTAVTTEVGQSVPALGADGTVYIGGDQLYAINPDGSLKWKVFDPTYEARRNSPVVGHDGTVYFVYHNIPLTALDPASGSAIWSCPLGVNDHCFASPAIGSDGTIYVATQPGIVFAVSSAGQISWQFDIASAGFTGVLRSSPAVDADGAIYFGINYGNPSSALFALNPDGSVRWIFQPSDLPPDVPGDHFDIYSSPAIGSDGTIYFGQELGRVYALDPADGSVRWIETTRSGITWSSPTLAADGTLFIADLSGRCYAIETESRGLKTTAPWPKFRRDNGNTGRVGLARDAGRFE
jgi:outer membrane protein assembly factor BamB